MDLDEALQFLHLRADSTITELETSFRTLIKVYHPDKNQHRTEWSHQMTVKLNEAYDLIHCLIEERAKKEQEKTAETSKARRADPQAVRNFKAAFAEAKHEALQGIFLYYNYGLQNVHLRKEGVLHYKYRSALHHLRKGIDGISPILSQAPSEKAKNYLVLYRLFCESFFQNMKLAKIHSAGDPLELKAYQHYRNGANLLDAVIKSKFLPRDFSDVMITTKSLAISEHEFMVVLTHFKTSTWVQEAISKLTLIELIYRLEKIKTGST